MKDHIKKFPDIHLRSEYDPSEPTLKDSCEAVTAVLDELMTVSPVMQMPMAAMASAEGLQLDRSFNYLISDGQIGTSWQLTENKYYLSYSRKVDNRGQVETYCIESNEAIQQLGITGAPIKTRYEIEYYGKDRHGFNGTVYALDLSSDDSAYVERPVTLYDADQIMNQLELLCAFIESHRQDDKLVSIME